VIRLPSDYTLGDIFSSQDLRVMKSIKLAGTTELSCRLFGGRRRKTRVLVPRLIDAEPELVDRVQVLNQFVAPLQQHAPVHDTFVHFRNQRSIPL
jgi:hypothetical protein